MKLLVFDHGRPRLVDANRDTDAYRRYRKRIDGATSYGDLLARLTAALQAKDRDKIAADFAPSESYARKFLATTALYLSRPRASAEHKQALRATKLLSELLWSGALRPGRPRSPEIDPMLTARGLAAVDFWLGLVRPLWHAAGESRGTLARAIGLAVADRFTWTAAHERDTAKMLARRSCRPSTVAIQLAAWELDLSVRQVRQCRRRDADEVMHA